MTLFWFKEFIKLAVLPPGGPLLLALIGLIVARRRPRGGRALILVGVVSLALLCIPAIGGLLVRSLDRSPPFDVANAGGAQAIVILGGGTRRYAPEYGGTTANSITLERVRYGARLARATGLPILVSGGPVRGERAEAPMMRDILENEFRVPVRWVESRSRDTHENALRSAEILRQSGMRRVILVGHAFDFPRTTAEFAAAGIDAVAAPIEIPPVVPTTLRDFLPSVTGLRLSYYALYEILANAAFRLSH
jgi:uncharacterized SAM-binding protein YcdF (DUF218 family)